jgi:hypothetical protein
MPGTDPASDAHPTDPWFDGEDDLLRWHEWWIKPPATAEKATASTELAALDRELGRRATGDLGDWAVRLRRVGEVLLAALAADFADDPTAQLSGTTAWLSALNRRLGEARVALRLGHVYPGQRFDPDAMEALDSLSGNRFLVHCPLSWVVRDVSQPKTRVALRARVITA